MSERARAFVQRTGGIADAAFDERLVELLDSFAAAVWEEAARVADKCAEQCERRMGWRAASEARGAKMVAAELRARGKA